MKYLIVLKEKRIENIKAEGKIETVNLIVTDRCNLACTHCCANALTLNGEDTLDKNDYFNIVDKVVDEINPEYIVVSGGEPLVRKDILNICKYIRKKFSGKLELMTNGLLINDSNIGTLKECFDAISISIDGIDEESCKIIRGNNVFSKVIDKVKFLKENNFNKISLSAVLPRNRAIEKEFEKMCKELGVQPLIRYLSMSGRAGNNIDIINKKMEKYLIEKDMKIDSEDLLVYVHDNKSDIRVSSCGACKNVITIGEDGSIYPCNLLMKDKFKIANIQDRIDILQIVKDKNNIGCRNLNNLRLGKNKYCEKCKVNMFCWSCLAECDDLLGNEEVFKKRCNEVKVKLNNVIWG